MRKGLALFMSACFCLLLFGCSHSPASSPEAAVSDPHFQSPDPDPTLRIWSWFSLDTQVQEFRKKHPEVKIQVTVLDYQKAHSTEYLKALANHEAPDIFMVDAQLFGGLNSFIGFEDLNNPAYNLEAWKSVIPEDLWTPLRSFDGREQLGIPFNMSPTVTYYRADLLGQYGFPTDPKELGDYMENPSNWVHMAKVLKEHGIYICQWKDEPLYMAGLDRTYFDDQLQFTRTTKPYADAYTAAREVQENKLSLEISVWDEKGKEALRQNQLAMVYLGSWAENTLRDWAPNTEGKWRAARLPFGSYGFDNITSLAISSESKHKKAAWDFITFFISDPASLGSAGSNVFAYTPARRNPEDMDRKNEFLGGEKSQALFEDLADHTSKERLTPLDKEADQLWKQAFYENLGPVSDPNKALELMAQKVETGLHEPLGSIRKLWWGTSP